MEKKIMIIGAGISSATIANVLANKGWKVTIYEKQDHIGGNCYDSYNNGILIHNYGPHIFHTSNEEVYGFISQFTSLTNYVNKVLVNVDNKLFPLPINFTSIKKIMGKKANSVIDTLKTTFPNRKSITIFDIRQVEDPLVEEFVDYISKNVYYNYSSKMWGVPFNEINPETINRVKIVLGYEHNYFPDDKYQGLPVDGYTQLIQKMFTHPNITINLNVNALDHIKFFEQKITWDSEIIEYPIVYCGPLDEASNYIFGMLPYRSINIEFETLNRARFQKTAVVNYPAHQAMTRICEYKLMTGYNLRRTTVLSKEYPGKFVPTSKEFNVRYYPIVNDDNMQIYQQYVSYFDKFSNFYPLGRLAQYKYYDMDDAIKAALDLAKQLSK